MHWRRKWQPTPVFLPGEIPGTGGACWAAVYGVAQSRTQLKRLSSSSSSSSRCFMVKHLLSPFFLMDAVLDVEDVKLKDDPCLYVISNLVGENLSGEIYKTV